LKLRILFVMVQSAECKRLEDRAIVLMADRLGGHHDRIKLVVRTCFVIEDSCVELLFSGEVPEDHGLRDTCRVGNFLGGCTPKAPLGKKTHRHSQNLRPALLPSHPGAPRRPLYCHLLTQSYIPSLSAK